MKNSLNKVTTKIQPIMDTVRHHSVIIFVVFFFGVYTFLIVRINSLVNSEPGPATVTDRLQTVKRVKIDQESIDRMLEMEEQNIDVQALFEQARQNPFNE